MKIQYLSDVHLEMHRDGGKAFLRDLPTAGDVLVIAGDFGVVALRSAFESLLDRGVPIVFVPGNHEFYKGTPRATLNALRKLAVEARHFHLLEPGTTVTLGGRRFLGSTLWFPCSASAQQHRYRLNDFHVIGGFDPWVYQENARAVAALWQDVRLGDVVVTHHLPSARSIHARYAGDPLNVFYVCPLDDLIMRRQPALWIHGHTHDSTDYFIGATRIVCNPRGYPHELNPAFRWDAVVELPETTEASVS